MAIDLFDPRFVQVLKCPHCPYMTKRLGQLFTHEFQTHKKSSSATLYKCSICDVIATTSDLVDDHIKFDHEINENAETQELFRIVLIPKGCEVECLTQTENLAQLIPSAKQSEVIDDDVVIRPEDNRRLPPPSEKGDRLLASVLVSDGIKEEPVDPEDPVIASVQHQPPITNVRYQQANNMANLLKSLMSVVPGSTEGSQSSNLRISTCLRNVQNNQQIAAHVAGGSRTENPHSVQGGITVIPVSSANPLPISFTMTSTGALQLNSVPYTQRLAEQKMPSGTTKVGHGAVLERQLHNPIVNAASQSQTTTHGPHAQLGNAHIASNALTTNSNSEGYTLYSSPHLTMSQLQGVASTNLPNQEVLQSHISKVYARQDLGQQFGQQSSKAETPQEQRLQCDVPVSTPDRPKIISVNQASKLPLKPATRVPNFQQHKLAPGQSPAVRPKQENGSASKGNGKIKCTDCYREFKTLPAMRIHYSAKHWMPRAGLEKNKVLGNQLGKKIPLMPLKSPTHVSQSGVLHSTNVRVSSTSPARSLNSGPSTSRLQVSGPSTVRPPVSSPSIVRPPVSSPSIVRPPVSRLSTVRPSVSGPSTVRPPVSSPSIVRPPDSHQPTSRPPVSHPTIRPLNIRPPTAQSMCQNDNGPIKNLATSTVTETSTIAPTYVLCAVPHNEKSNASVPPILCKKVQSMSTNDISSPANKQNLSSANRSHQGLNRDENVVIEIEDDASEYNSVPLPLIQEPLSFERQYRCRACSKSFKGQSELIHHINVCHRNFEEGSEPESKKRRKETQLSSTPESGTASASTKSSPVKPDGTGINQCKTCHTFLPNYSSFIQHMNVAHAAKATIEVEEYAQVLLHRLPETGVLAAVSGNYVTGDTCAT